MLKEIGRSETYACKRIYYLDEENRLVERRIHPDHSATIEANKDAAFEYRAHARSDMREIAEIPVSIYLDWLMEENIPTFADDETLQMLTRKKLRDPKYQYLLKVPSTYRMMKHG